MFVTHNRPWSGGGNSSGFIPPPPVELTSDTLSVNTSGGNSEIELINAYTVTVLPITGLNPPISLNANSNNHLTVPNGYVANFGMFVSFDAFTSAPNDGAQIRLRVLNQDTDNSITLIFVPEGTTGGLDFGPFSDSNTVTIAANSTSYLVIEYNGNEDAQADDVGPYVLREFIQGY